MKSEESFLVTGAAGFVGSCLTQRLVKQGKKVSVFVKSDTNPWRLKDVRSHLNIHTGDLTDKKFVSEAIHKIKPTVIYHLATHGAYPIQKDAEKIILTNVLGTWNLLNACADVDYKVFVNTGSSSEYGFKQFPMQETDFLEPNSYYAVAKSAQTLLCQHVARSQKCPVVTFRLFSVYGYYEEPTRLIPTLIRKCLSGEDLEMVSAQTARDFVFVEDVVDAYLKIERLKNLSGEIINIGSGTQGNLKQVVDLVVRLTGARVKVKWGKMPARIWDADIWIAGTKKCKKVLGWEAKISLKEGLKKTIQWSQERH